MQRSLSNFCRRKAFCAGSLVAAGLLSLLLVPAAPFLKAAPPEATDLDFPHYEAQHPDEVADTVILKSGKVYTNVKTFPRGGSHTLKFQNGGAIVVPNAKIKIVRIKGVSWKTKQPQRKMVAAVVKKRKPRSQQPQRVVKPKLPIGRDIIAMQNDQTANPEQERDIESGLGPVSKSILVPGWGQYSLGHRWRAAAIVVAGLPIVQAYWVHRNEHTEAQEIYSETFTPYLLAQPQNTPWGIAAYYTVFDYRRSELLRKEDQTNNMVFALLGLWGLQTLDAYYLNLLQGGQHPFFKFADKLSFTGGGLSPTTILAFSDGENFILGIGVHF